MKKCAIITSYIEGSLSELLPDYTDFFVIAADGGLKHALGNNIPVDMIIGDFDSYDGIIPDGIPVMKVPSEKDDTDSGLSISYAIENGFDEIVIIGGIGGRLDHTIANIQVMSGAAEKGVKISMRSKGNYATTIKDSAITLKFMPNSTFSVFSLSEYCRDVTIKNAKYPLNNHFLANNVSLGCSNEFIGGDAQISVKEGVLLIVVSKKF